jgi:hypothetical protein
MTKLTGSTNSDFGFSVAMAGDTIVVGANSDDNTKGSSAGAVYVFSKAGSSSSWTQMTQLLAADGAANGCFGASVSISKDASTIVIGALRTLGIVTTISDAAYLFRMVGSTKKTTTVKWTQVGKFVEDDPAAFDGLGASIAIENNICVVGAPFDDPTSGIVNSGSVYVLFSAQHRIHPRIFPSKTFVSLPPIMCMSKEKVLFPCTC